MVNLKDKHNRTPLHLSASNGNDDIEGLNIIRAFIADQSLNDYLNAAVDNYEYDDHHDNHEENQENIDPKSRYAQIYFTKRHIEKFYT